MSRIRSLVCAALLATATLLVGVCHAWRGNEPSDDERRGESVCCTRFVCVG